LAERGRGKGECGEGNGAGGFENKERPEEENVYEVPTRLV